ncbi:MAG: AAA family ATPase [Gemmatimonadota bacterium]|nr:AAA family ATPase [Gemmatimonadota bacterium]
MFGKPDALDSSGQPIPGLGLGKPLGLLSYLLIEGKTSRETLIGLLWGDVPEVKARNAFRQALHRLRTALGESVIPQDPDALFVAGDADLATDVQRFERLLGAGDSEKAILEYAGDFLSGLSVAEPAFDEWVESKRKRYRAMFRDALRAAVQNELESGEIALAIQHASTLAESDPIDPAGAVLYANTLLGAGRRAEALHALEEFERRFKSEMDALPPASVREFSSRLRRAPAERGARSAPRTKSTFVGRETELALLLARLKSLESGKGSVVVIDGESGVGKTRLLDEFFIRAADFGSPLLLLGREQSPEAAIPYASLAEALRGLLDAPGISGTGQHLLAEAARLLPQLRDQFSLPSIDEIADDAGRLRFYEGIAALLDSVAYEQATCIALDDFHNCSRTTFGLVQYLAERLKGAPILFVISGRSGSGFAELRRLLYESLSRGSRSVAGDGREPALVTLVGLAGPAARELIEDLAGSTIDETTVEEILAVSGGLPFGIAEAVERVRNGDPFQRAPVRIRDVLWSRLQRCTQAEQRLFVTVALFDRAVPIRLLAAASHLPEKSALDAAMSLERDGFLLQRPEGMTPAHDFAADLALEGTGPAGRALLAGWAAEALERDESGSAGELARLFSLAGRRREAFTYSRAAAYEALSSGASDAALQHFESALTTAPSGTEREEIDTMLRSLGSGSLRLPGETTGPAQSAGIATPSAQEAPQPTSKSAPIGEESTGSSAKPAHAPARSIRSIAIITAASLAVVFAVFKTVSKAGASRTPGTSLADTLIVAREIDPRDTVIAFTTGQLGSALNVLDGATRHGRTRTWVDSLRLPWTNPLVSPDGRSVAVERITKEGSDLYVISSDRRDTIRLSSRRGDDFASGWSPDSRWILSTHGETRSDGSYGSDLFGYSVVERDRRIAFDTATARGVVEASWSPDGSHVAWTARVGALHQQDVFISDADGSQVMNLTNDPGEDYSIAWSPDGNTVAFTSERTGRAELYSENIATHSLRRLTWEGAHADHAIFSPDGRWLAYESTKGGSPAVYVMPSAGGTGRSVAPSSARVTLVGWRGTAVPYLDQILADVPRLANPGDAGGLIVRAIDRNGNPIRPGSIRVKVLDSTLVRISGILVVPVTSMTDTIQVTALARGLARVTISAGSWRADTAFIPIGQETLTLLDDNFERGLNREAWRALGYPSPTTKGGVGAAGSAGLVTRSDREWESGVLSRTVFPVRGGIAADVWVKAPFTDRATAARSFVIALVAADPEEVIDSLAPQFLRLATVAWLGEAGRLSYGVGREVFTEPLSQLGGGSEHRITITVGSDDLVAFFVDGRQRWKSGLRLTTEGDNSRAQLWLGGQGAGEDVVFDEAAVRLKMLPATQPKRE